MTRFFMSDAHLGENFKKREELKLARLHSFLEMVLARGRELYIVGDLFDFWFEYRHAIPKHHLRTILKFARLKEAGIDLHYITGNHDHWLGDFLSGEVGFEIHRDDYRTELDGKRLLITHGDGIAKKDRGYRMLKRILRNRFNIFMYRLIPPDLGIPLAKHVSQTSRGHTQKRPKESFLAEYRNYAHQQLRSGEDIVIIAHTHVPEKVEFEEGLYFNTGDWVENFSYLEMEAGRIELKFWEDSSA
ncbi:MAG: UDP-2,3-diacylglucosamine diphosphatase [candidate division Zixibacteria bacterium]|nr:UDP-2,3-diacylglucosamine diphosphatase [candidate division Zixibacteria bacterium]